MLVTDDGDFAHRILSPKRHVPKTYRAKIDGPLTEQMIKGFAEGVALEDGVLCRPAQLLVLEEGEHAALPGSPDAGNVSSGEKNVPGF